MERFALTGVMCWFDESPSWLMASVTAIAPLLDHLVILDGCYALWPGSMKRPASTIDQSLAVLEACNACNLSVTLHRPTRPYYGNEVEKRQLSVDLASLFTTPDEGWYLVFDADQVARPMRVEAIRRELAESDEIVGEYGLHDLYDPQAFNEKHGGKVDFIEHDRDAVTKVRGLYRALPGLTYGPAHWILSAPTSEENKPIWLWGNPKLHRPYVHDTLDLSSDLIFDHRNRERERGRRRRAEQYYERREKTGIEEAVRTYSEGLHGEAVPVRPR